MQKTIHHGFVGLTPVKRLHPLRECIAGLAHAPSRQGRGRDEACGAIPETNRFPIEASCARNSGAMRLPNEKTMIPKRHIPALTPSHVRVSGHLAPGHEQTMRTPRRPQQARHRENQSLPPSARAQAQSARPPPPPDGVWKNKRPACLGAGWQRQPLPTCARHAPHQRKHTGNKRTQLIWGAKSPRQPRRTLVEIFALNDHRSGQNVGPSSEKTEHIHRDDNPQAHRRL